MFRRTNYFAGVLRIALLLGLCLAAWVALLALVATPFVFAAEAAERPAPTLLLPPEQAVAILLGVLSPIVTYVINYAAPWVDEKVKGIVHVLVAGVVAGVYQAIELGEVGFNQPTLQIVLSAIIAALAAHNLLYRPSGISAALGGGRNAQDDPRR